MSFIADQQTLEDLNIPGKFRRHSMFRFFDKVVTTAGGRLLEQLFRQPLTDADAINRRCDVFRFFGSLSVSFPISNHAFTSMTHYLNAEERSNLAATAIQCTWQKVQQVVARGEVYAELVAGITQTHEVLIEFRRFARLLQARSAEDGPCAQQFARIHQLFNHPALHTFITAFPDNKMTLARLIRYDYWLRGCLRAELQELTDIIIQWDVNIAVSRVAVEKKWQYPHALPARENHLSIKGLYHPAVNKPVTNDITFDVTSNVVFLTGANMAGKSTFMKSFGIAVYLAHMGFPVAVDEMTFSVKDGLYSSVNVPDDVKHGYSHFYAEVLRVKKVAEAVSTSKQLVVILDELFKGTNVKDAFDATLAITEAFAENNHCFFIISTHIMEVGEILRERCPHMQFLYLPTLMNGVRPSYTYRLATGISADRQGMLIINNEGIVDIIRKGI